MRRNLGDKLGEEILVAILLGSDGSLNHSADRLVVLDVLNGAGDKSLQDLQSLGSGCFVSSNHFRWRQTLCMVELVNVSIIGRRVSQ